MTGNVLLRKLSMEDNKAIQYRTQQTQGVSDKFSTLKNLEINVTNSCNRVCDNCPHSVEDYEYQYGRADLSLFNTLAAQLIEKNYNGSIVLCGFGEPTMYKHLALAVEILSATNANIELITNGELLNRDNVAELFSVGLSVLNISVYEESFLEHAHQLVAGLKEDQWLIRDRYSEKQAVVNRIEIFKDIKTTDRSTPCWLPAYKMLLDHNGDVMLCCNDWTRSTVFGNIFETNVWDIWTEKMQAKRLELLEGKNITGVCTNCNVYGNTYGVESVRFYNND